MSNDEKFKQFLNTLSSIIKLQEEENKQDWAEQSQAQLKQEIMTNGIQMGPLKQQDQKTDMLYGYTSPDPGGGDGSESNGGDVRNILKVSHASNTHNTEPSIGDALAWAKLKTQLG